jgi:hypothetical protein
MQANYNKITGSFILACGNLIAVLSAITSLVPITTNSLARLSTKGQPTPMVYMYMHKPIRQN